MRADYERAAWDAVTYTRGRLKADNKFWDRFWGDLSLPLDLKKNRARMVAAGLFEKDTLKSVGERSTAAQVAGCGNCQEHADTAFIYLHDHHIVPIEMMNFRGRDHAFDVIGRPADSDVSDPSTWGQDAVVCDPWLEKVYPPSDLKKYWAGGTPFVRIRVDTPGLRLQQAGR